MNEPLSFGLCLKKIINVFGISTKKLAEHLHYELSTIYKWQSGKRLPDEAHFDIIIEQIITLLLERIHADLRLTKRIHAFLDDLIVEMPNHADHMIVRETYYRVGLRQLLVQAYSRSKHLQREKRTAQFSRYYALTDQEPARYLGSQLLYSTSSTLEVCIELLDLAAHNDSHMNKNILFITNAIDNDPLIKHDLTSPIMEKLDIAISAGWKLHILHHNCKDFPSHCASQKTLIISGVGALICYCNVKSDIQLSILIMDTAAVANLFDYYYNLDKFPS